MLTIALQPVPNQSFTMTLGGDVYELTLQAAKGIMAATLARNGTTLLSGFRCVANSPLIPYRYMESGNFLLLTANNEELPDYAAFGVTQSLVYLTADELAALRSPRLVFSPLGGQPLRYKPLGYRVAP